MLRTPMKLAALLVLSLSTGLVGCQSAEKAADQVAAAPSDETKMAARQAQASYASEVTFDKNSAVLTEGSREALKGMMESAKAAGSVDAVKVLAWSDQAYPADTTKAKALPKAARDLAAKRGKAIQDFMKAELSVSSIDTLNMADRPNAFQSFFNTTDAKMKDAFEQAGVTSNDGNSINGKPSRAVVLVMLEQK